MTTLPRLRRGLAALVATAALCALAACASSPGETKENATGHTHYPLTVQNCGVDLTFQHAPERVLLNNSYAVPYLQSLGVLDRTVARAGMFPAEYFDAATNATLAKVPLLTDRLDTGGHLVLSREVIIDQEPDLMFGLPDGITRENMAAVGILTYVAPVSCPTGVEHPSFDDIYTQMRWFGQVFDRNAEAEVAVGQLQDRVAALSKYTGEFRGKSAAVLYPTPGSVTTYAYGTKSMAAPQLELLGLTNAFGDTDQRVFEVTMEELLGRDPDFLILLHQTDDPAAIKAAITSIPGAAELKAVKNDAIFVQLFNFTEPTSPLSIDGTERIADHFSGR